MINDINLIFAEISEWLKYYGAKKTAIRIWYNGLIVDIYKWERVSNTLVASSWVIPIYRLVTDGLEWLNIICKVARSFVS